MNCLALKNVSVMNTPLKLSSASWGSGYKYRLKFCTYFTISNVRFLCTGDSAVTPTDSYNDNLQPVQMGKATKGKLLDSLLEILYIIISSSNSLIRKLSDKSLENIFVYSTIN